MDSSAAHRRGSGKDGKDGKDGRNHERDRSRSRSRSNERPEPLSEDEFQTLQALLVLAAILCVLFFREFEQELRGFG